MNNFSDFYNQYDGFLIDIWGVIHNGIDPYLNVINTINKLKEEKAFLLLSNNPRPNYVSFTKLKNLGLNLEVEQIFTSGDLVREQFIYWNDEIFKSLGKKFYHLGAERNQDILNDIKAKICDDIGDVDFILLTAFINENENISVHDDVLQKAKERNLIAICANPDTIVYEGAMKRLCAGAIAKRYIDMGGVVHYYGKPDRKIYDKAITKLSISKDKILMIGDTLDTDIKGACLSNIDSCLVLTGNGINSLRESEDSIIKPTYIIKNLAF